MKQTVVSAVGNKMSCIRAPYLRWHCLEMLKCFKCRCWKQILFIAPVVSNAARAGSQTQSGSRLFSSYFGEVVFFLNNVGFIFIPASFPSFSFIPSRAELRVWWMDLLFLHLPVTSLLSLSSGFVLLCSVKLKLTTAPTFHCWWYSLSCALQSDATRYPELNVGRVQLLLR